MFKQQVVLRILVFLTFYLDLAESMSNTAFVNCFLALWILVISFWNKIIKLENTINSSGVESSLFGYYTLDFITTRM